MQEKEQQYLSKEHNLAKTRVVSLPTKQAVFCDFYVRLYAFLGEPSSVQFEGFTYTIYDQKNDFYFSAELNGFGAGYFAGDDTQSTKNYLKEFHAQLFASDLELKDCLLEYEHDFGRSVMGFAKGEIICREIEE